MKEYRNYTRSKSLIRGAFANLLAEKKSIDKITVKDIVARADISKSTFYAHYQDIYAVIKEFENEVLDLLLETIEEYSETPNDEFMPYINKILAELKRNEELFSMILKGESPSFFLAKLKKKCNEKINKDINLTAFSKDPDIRYAEISFLTSGFTDLILDYFNGNLKISLDEIGQLINHILTSLAFKK